MHEAELSITRMFGQPSRPRIFGRTGWREGEKGGSETASRQKKAERRKGSMTMMYGLRFREKPESQPKICLERGVLYSSCPIQRGDIVILAPLTDEEREMIKAQIKERPELLMLNADAWRVDEVVHIGRQSLSGEALSYLVLSQTDPPIREHADGLVC